MAKKQQIILTHGSATPSADVIKGLKLGEVLVQHAADAKEVALHTVNKEGDSATLISFPSKEWVQDKINSVDAAGIGKKITTIEGRLDVIEEDYLTSADKVAIEEKIGDEYTAENTVAMAIAKEAQDRKDADTAIEEKIGGEYTKTNTVAMAIAKEVKDREDAVKAIQDAIDALGDTYYTETEIDALVSTLNENIAKAKTTLTEAADVTAGVKVVKTTDTDGHDNYEITAVGLATTGQLGAVDTRVGTVETNYIKQVVVKDKEGQIVKTYTPANNVLDLTELIIDGGEY
jgi:ribosomal protein S9